MTSNAYLTPQELENEVKRLFLCIDFYLKETSIGQEIFLAKVSAKHEKSWSGDILTQPALSKCLKDPPKRTSQAFFFAACKYLEGENYWPIDKHLYSYFGVFADFFDMKNDKYIKELHNYYECYQWSSRKKGFIMVSLVEISNHKESYVDSKGRKKDDYPFLSVIETQKTSEEFAKKYHIQETEEYYDGLAFSRHACVYFLMRERQYKHPKMCIFYNINRKHEGVPILYGIMLKGSRYRGMDYHVSRIYMKKIDSKKECHPRLSEADELSDIADILSENIIQNE